ncbi:CbtB domain-containing protein [Nocardioides acrostichi]|uniref:CbtB-domain containing protein n=1 Tax=Nocardioides acrostichi TaxID=2784339 RepID=A0A930UYZ8_9ACTN|nr:CbtB-domain containing protein [Nocardioides acrostichi]MBF4162686.1 CbtB-domain containing protein [Nocardioides acrostichi]
MSQISPAPLTSGTASLPAVPVAAIPLRELAPWALLFALLGALVLFFVGVDQGAVSVPSGVYVHELVHDGRHLLGYPCH